jgi:V8-like Glu-specific endopeptidase
MPKNPGDKRNLLEQKVAHDPIFTSLLITDPAEAIKLTGILLTEDDTTLLPQMNMQDVGLAGELSKQLRSGQRNLQRQTVQQVNENALLNLSPQQSAAGIVMSIFVARELLDHSVQVFSKKHFAGKKFDFPSPAWWHLSAHGDSLELELSENKPRLIAQFQCKFSFDLNLEDYKAKANNINIPLTVEAQPIFAIDDSEQLYLSIKKGQIDLVGLCIPDRLGQDFGAEISSMLPFLPVCTLPTVFDFASSDVLETPKTSLRLKSIDVDQTGISLQLSAEASIKITAPVKKEHPKNTDKYLGPMEETGFTERSIGSKESLESPSMEEFTGVVGADNRKYPLTRDIQAAPWKWVCWMNNNNRELSSFSGFLVGPQLILTVAHGLYEKYPGRFIDWLQVIPGCAGKDKSGTFITPNGHAIGISVLVPEEWIAKKTDETTNDYDFGIVVLPPDQALGANLGWFNAIAMTESDIVGKYPILAGYPNVTRDGSTATLWAASGDPILSVKQHVMYFTLDGTVGQSGSPVFVEGQFRKYFPGGWGKDNPINNAVGIFSFIDPGKKQNGAKRINMRIVDAINILRANPNALVQGLRRKVLQPPPPLRTRPR